MSFKSEDGIVAGHTFAVVGDFQKPPSTGLDIDHDALCAGVDGILDEFFGH